MTGHTIETDTVQFMVGKAVNKSRYQTISQANAARMFRQALGTAGC